MICDCFTFFNELDLLEIRLNILNDIVDRFVLVEATRTHSNQQKPLYFEENKEKFAKFLHKIDHLIVNDYPEYKDSWTYEIHQRDYITKALKNCSKNDLIMISDLDEIPDPDLILEYKNIQEIIRFKQLMFYYYLNCINTKSPYWIFGTVIFLHKELKTHTPNQLRRGQWKTINNGGWHFSYLGGIEKIKHKIESFAHQEFNKKQFTDLKNIEKNIAEGKDLFGRKFKYTTVKLDNTLPEFILQHVEKYGEFIKKESKYLDLNKILRNYNRKCKIKMFFRNILRRIFGNRKRR